MQYNSCILNSLHQVFFAHPVKHMHLQKFAFIIAIVFYDNSKNRSSCNP